jgi:hypothetical protein
VIQSISVGIIISLDINYLRQSRSRRTVRDTACATSLMRLAHRWPGNLYIAEQCRKASNRCSLKKCFDFDKERSIFRRKISGSKYLEITKGLIVMYLYAGLKERYGMPQILESSNNSNPDIFLILGYTRAQSNPYINHSVVSLIGIVSGCWPIPPYNAERCSVGNMV